MILLVSMSETVLDQIEQLLDQAAKLAATNGVATDVFMAAAWRPAMTAR